MKKGFTLTQLLVVIAVIAVLSSIILASTSNVRAKSRDNRRAIDLNQVKIALEYYLEANGHYPYSCATNPLASFDSPLYSPNQLCSKPINDVSAIQIGTLETVLAPYMKGVPKDPKLNGNDSGYLYINQQFAYDYCFMAFRTPENLKFYASNMINPARCGGYNANGQCNTPGTFLTDNQVNSVYIGKGTYKDGVVHDGC